MDKKILKQLNNFSSYFIKDCITGMDSMQSFLFHFVAYKYTY